MALLEVRWNPSARELRWFALGLALLLGILGVLQATRSGFGFGRIAPLVGALFALLGVWRPELMRPVYVIWMAAAYPIGWIVSHAVLVGTYLLVITPIGLVMRTMRDPMRRRLERSRTSYWIPRDPVRKPSRYLQQF